MRPQIQTIRQSAGNSRKQQSPSVANNGNRLSTHGQGASASDRSRNGKRRLMKLTPDLAVERDTTTWTQNLGTWVSSPSMLAAILLTAILWSYWPTLCDLARFWVSNSDYSSGFFVPLIAGYVVWGRRKQLASLPRHACWWGLIGLLLIQMARMAGFLMGYGSVEQYSVPASIVAVVLVIFGRPTVRSLVWVLFFLLLMVPLPRMVHGLVALPLQSFAAASAVLGLEILGYLVARDGNVLRLSDSCTVAVAEACSGLRMLMAFVVVGATLAFVVRRPLWQKVVLVLATLPVAVLANTLRLIVTVALYQEVGSRIAERFFHDFAGLTMMPFAVAVLVGLLWLMRWAGSPQGAAAVRLPLPTKQGAHAPTAISGGPACNSLRLAPGAVALAAAVVVVGGLGQRGIEQLLVAADAVPVALARPLSSLPMQVGPWRGTDVPMDKRVIEVAGNDAQVYRRYQNQQTGEVVDFYLAFAARPAKMLGHRPRVCYPAHGWMPVGEPHRQPIALPGGDGFDVLIDRFAKEQPSPEAIVVLNYYILGGRYVTAWTDFWGPRWRLPNLSRDPNIYVAQIQVTARATDPARSASAEDLVKRFVAEMAGRVGQLLPRVQSATDMGGTGVGPVSWAEPANRQLTDYPSGRDRRGHLRRLIA